MMKETTEVKKGEGQGHVPGVNDQEVVTEVKDQGQETEIGKTGKGGKSVSLTLVLLNKII